MDDYDLQQELEALAGNAYNPDLESDNAEPEPMKDTMARWQKLFGLTGDEAVDRIMDHRNNLVKTRISNTHWETVRMEKEAEGHDRESYEYDLELQKKKANLPSPLPAGDHAEESDISYLVELTGPLDTAEKIQSAAKMSFMPPVLKGTSVEKGRPVKLCMGIDGQAKANILHWASEKGGGFEPTILVDPRSLRR